MEVYIGEFYEFLVLDVFLFLLLVENLWGDCWRFVFLFVSNIEDIIECFIFVLEVLEFFLLLNLGLFLILLILGVVIDGGC